MTSSLEEKVKIKKSVEELRRAILLLAIFAVLQSFVMLWLGVSWYRLDRKTKSLENDSMLIAKTVILVNDKIDKACNPYGWLDPNNATPEDIR